MIRLGPAPVRSRPRCSARSVPVGPPLTIRSGMALRPPGARSLAQAFSHPLVRRSRSLLGPARGLGAGGERRRVRPRRRARARVGGWRSGLDGLPFLWHRGPAELRCASSLPFRHRARGRGQSLLLAPRSRASVFPRAGPPVARVERRPGMGGTDLTRGSTQRPRVDRLGCLSRSGTGVRGSMWGTRASVFSGGGVGVRGQLSRPRRVRLRTPRASCRTDREARRCQLRPALCCGRPSTRD